LTKKALRDRRGHTPLYGDRYTQSPENTQGPCKPPGGHISGLNIPTIFPGISLGGMYK